jgi:thiosulfate sulfurtransferase
MSFQRISVAQAKVLIAEGGAAIADVRDPGSFAAGHVESAVNVSDANVQAFLQDLDFEKPVIVYCYHGNMSQGAAHYFAEQGCSAAYSVDGGFEQWRHEL